MKYLWLLVALLFVSNPSFAQKVSALPAATTPLAGTELVPCVQPGTSLGTTSKCTTQSVAQSTALSGDVATTIGSSIATIQPGVVTLANQANLAANAFECNNTGSPATPIACTATQAKSVLAIANTDVSGLGTFAVANTATPPGIGTTTPNTGAFSTLSASSTVSGTGFSTYLASPPAIGGSAAAAGTFTALTSTTSAANLASNLTQAANTSADGLTLIDSTAATVGAQQYSPRIRLTGQGWATTPVASRTIDWIIEAQPIQGTTNPSTNLAFSYQINGGGYTAGPIIGTTNITTGGGGTGTMNGSVNVGNAAITGNGIYHFGTNSLGFSTNATSAGDIDATQHWRLGGAGAATIASGACGATTNGTIAGNDHAGLITIGSASTATCAITFAGNYTTVPRAVLLQAANAGAASALSGEFISVLATTGFTISGTLASTNWYYWVQ